MKTHNFSGSWSLEAGHITRTRTIRHFEKKEEDNAAATGNPPPSSDPPFTVSEYLRTIEAWVFAFGSYNDTVTNFLTCRTSGHPVPHRSLSTYALANSIGYPMSHRKHHPFRSHRGRKTPNCQLNPHRARRALHREYYHPHSTASLPRVRSFIRVFHLPHRSSGELHGRSARRRAISLTAPPPASSPTTALDTELALPARPPLEIVDEKPATAHGGMDLDAPLWEYDANEDEYIDAGEGAGIEGDLDVEDE